MRFRTRATRALAASAAAVASALFASPALAQDCRLEIQAMKEVLMPGQSTDVQVFARFSPSAYAFASAQFRVLGDIPAWTYASAGAIAGSDVVNIDVGQAHQPWLGVFADASNPLRIWRGTFQPTSWVPQLIALETSPTLVSVYPSKITSSPAPCTPHRDRDYILVNPLPVWRTGVAPGLGTSIVRTGPNEIHARATSGPLVLGLLLPADQRAAAAARTTIASALPLTELTLTVVPQRQQVQGGNIEFEWKVEDGESSAGCRVTWSDATRYEFHALRGGALVRVFSGTSNALPFPLPVLPATFGVRAELDRSAGENRVIGVARFESPQRFSVPGSLAFVCDELEVHAVRSGLQKVGLGTLVLTTANTYQGHSGGANFQFADGHVHF